MKQHICSGCKHSGKVTWCKTEELQCVPEIFDNEETENPPPRYTSKLTPEIQKLVDESSERAGWIF